MNQTTFTIAGFFSHHNILDVQPFGNGNINDTYLVTDSKRQFILQRLNSTVFQNPNLIFKNQIQLQQLLGKNSSPHVHIPQLQLTQHGQSFHQDSKKKYWRAQEFIENSCEISQLSESQAKSVGNLLGSLHTLCDEQTTTLFHDTLPDLHHTTHHINHFMNLKHIKDDAPQVQLTFCLNQIKQHQQEAIHLDQQLHSPTIPKRLIHGDPKLANILFDKDSNQACSLIDLDTIGPGIIHHDLADLIRSCCNPTGEESNYQDVHFKLSLAKKIITGYCSKVASLLVTSEIQLLGKSLWVIPFELGIRFLNDYLAGSTYFKTTFPHQNIYRACNQFQLAEQIKQKQDALQQHFNDCLLSTKAPLA